MLQLGKAAELYFYRDSHGNEVNLLMRDEGRITPVEIKSSSTFHPDFLKGIERFRAIAGERVDEGFLLYNGEQSLRVRGVRVLNPLAAA